MHRQRTRNSQARTVLSTGRASYAEDSDPETTEKDPLEATTSTYIGVPETNIKKEQNVSLDNIQVVPFESHLKELKGVFKDCQVPKSTSDKILNVLHAFDPRYPVQEKRREENIHSPSPPPPTKEPESDNSLSDMEMDTSTPAGINLGSTSALEKTIEKVFRSVFGTFDKRLTTLQESVDGLHSLVNQSMNAGRPNGSSGPMMILPLGPYEMGLLESPDVDPDYRKAFIQALIFRKDKPKSTVLKSVFTDQGLLQYNWTGKGERKIAINRSHLFGMVKAHWFNDDDSYFHDFVMIQWKKLGHRMNKRRIRALERLQQSQEGASDNEEDPDEEG